MMSSTRRRFQRPLGEKRYRKMVVIATEGAKTEPQYFGLFNSDDVTVHVNCLKGRDDSSPPHVLKRMEKYLKQEGLKSSDEAWLVVDKDRWSDEQLGQLHAWAQRRKNYGFVLSNPKFEYWLLLHFEDGKGIASSENCSDRLEKYIPNYNKGIDARKITQDQIEAAIGRAKRRDIPPCPDWPREIGCTTVYRLIESILRS
jgi:hypothetical protein